MVLEAGGEIGHSIALHDNAAKKGSVGAFRLMINFAKRLLNSLKNKVRAAQL